MDFDKILVELRAERNHVDRAIAAVEALAAPSTNRDKGAGTQSAAGGSRMSPAARKRMSEMMKHRWAERRKKAR